MDPHDVALVAVAVASLLAATLSYLNGKKLDVVHIAMNSRLDALIASSNKVAYAAGHDAAMQIGLDTAATLAAGVTQGRRDTALERNKPVEKQGL